jgi:peptidyl-prolyl cis-trans isomerase B (cyclophilin B)
MNVRMTTSKGDILLELNPEKAPQTVENFLAYVDSGHYNGTIFHRVIKDFMIQGGGLDADMTNKATNPGIQNEANNGLKNELGSISMARTGDPHSASAQFFINTNDNAFLDHRSETQDGWGYCVFGKVIDGMDIVEQIEDTTTTSHKGYQDVPAEVIEITRVEKV